MLQWPWLLQSSPVLFIVIGSCWTWASYDWRRALSLGLICRDKKTKEESKHSRHHVPGSINIEAPFYNDELAPYIYHLFGMSLPAFLVMHVNVATRFLSSSPVLYWFAAFIFSNQSRLKNKRVVWSTQNLIWTWALTFLALGSLLFPNFYPWT